MKKAISTAFVLLISIIGFAACLISLVFISLPNPARIKSCLTTEFKKVRLCASESTYVPLGQIAPILRSAIIISEDSSFYSHNGFDWHEMRESAEKNLAALEFRRGGSTISQQLVKNVFLNGDKSLLRKAKEAYLTWRLEKILSKDQILEKYLNVVELGPGIFGVKAAAQHYFDKSPAELNAAESSFLALLLPNPISYYTSFRQKKLTPFARSRVLDISKKLMMTGHISEGDYDQLVASLDGFPWRGGANTPIPMNDPAAMPSPEDDFAIPEPIDRSATTLSGRARTATQDPSVQINEAPVENGEQPDGDHEEQLRRQGDEQQQNEPPRDQEETNDETSGN